MVSGLRLGPNCLTALFECGRFVGRFASLISSFKQLKKKIKQKTNIGGCLGVLKKRNYLFFSELKKDFT